MMKRAFLPLAALIGASLLVQGCAGTPQAAGEPAPAKTVSKQELSAELDPVLAEAAQGYERLVKNGQLVFCRREQPVGSKMYTTVCLTEDQLRQQAVDNKKFKEGTMGQGRRCSSMGC